MTSITTVEKGRRGWPGRRLGQGGRRGQGGEQSKAGEQARAPTDAARRRRGSASVEADGGVQRRREQKSSRDHGLAAARGVDTERNAKGGVESGAGHGEGDCRRAHFVQEGRKAELNADVAGLLSSLPAQVVAGLVLLGLAAGSPRLSRPTASSASRVRLTIVLSLHLRRHQRGACDLRRCVRPIPSARRLGQPAPLRVRADPLRRARAGEPAARGSRARALSDDRAGRPRLHLFAMVATLVMEEKFLTTSAVGAVVAGLALQDTLGNLVSGLAIQVEKPFQARPLDPAGRVGRRGRRDHLARDEGAHARRQPGDHPERRAGQVGARQLLRAGVADAHLRRGRHQLRGPAEHGEAR